MIIKKKIAFIVFIIIFVVLFLEIQNDEIIVQQYGVECDISDEIRIIQLTDLHNLEFGDNNIDLVLKVREQVPDLIFMTGDMFGQSDNLHVIYSCIKQLSQIAPVYFSYGNHERSWENGTESELRKTLTEAGATVLNCEYIDIECKGESIRIGGYYGYYRAPHMRTSDVEEQEKEIAFADDFEDTENIKLLLCHIPTAWVDWEYIDKYPIDVVFTGHYHGGQIRLPFVGGLYAPYVGWFPENTKGIFEGQEATCILSTGLGSENWIPRINNPAEVVVIDLIKKEN